MFFVPDRTVLPMFQRNEKEKKWRTLVFLHRAAPVFLFFDDSPATCMHKGTVPKEKTLSSSVSRDTRDFAKKPISDHERSGTLKHNNSWCIMIQHRRPCFSFSVLQEEVCRICDKSMTLPSHMSRPPLSPMAQRALCSRKRSVQLMNEHIFFFSHDVGGSPPPPRPIDDIAITSLDAARYVTAAAQSNGQFAEVSGSGTSVRKPRPHNRALSASSLFAPPKNGNAAAAAQKNDTKRTSVATEPNGSPPPAPSASKPRSFLAERLRRHKYSHV